LRKLIRKFLERKTDSLVMIKNNKTYRRETGKGSRVEQSRERRLERVSGEGRGE
jgi:hypothetical protein